MQPGVTRAAIVCALMIALMRPSVSLAAPIESPAAGITAFTLANGIRLYVQRAATPDVVILGTVALSPAFDPPGKEGTGAIAIAALQTHGDAIYEYGDRFGAHVPASAVAHALATLSARARDASVSAAALTRIVAGETLAAAQRDAGIDVRLQRAFDRSIYGSSDPLLRYETAQSIAAIRRSDMTAFVNATFVPQNTTLIVVGNVDPAAVRGAAQTTFGRWVRPPHAPSVALPKPPHTMRSVTVIAGSDSVDRVRIGQAAPGRLDPDFYALTLLNAVLSARLARALPAADAATSSLLTTRDRGVLSVDFTAPPAELNADRDIAKATVDGVLRERIPAAEWNAARARLLAAPAISDPSQAGRIARLSNIARNALPPTYFATLATTYAVAPEDGLRAARRHLTPGAFAEVIVTSAAPKSAAPPSPSPSSPTPHDRAVRHW